MNQINRRLSKRSGTFKPRSYLQAAATEMNWALLRIKSARAVAMQFMVSSDYAETNKAFMRAEERVRQEYQDFKKTCYLLSR